MLDLSDDANQAWYIKILRNAQSSQTQIDELQTQQRIDAFHIPNRKFFNELLLMCKEGDCVAMIDIDHFKHVNDRYGHPAGDEILSQFAKILSANVDADFFINCGAEVGGNAETIIPTRYGGEEFALVFRNFSLSRVAKYMEDLRKEIAASTFDLSGVETKSGVDSLRITASVGIARYKNSIHGDPKNMIASADTALYVAKEKGRNIVVVSKSPTEFYCINGEMKLWHVERPKEQPVQDSLRTAHRVVPEVPILRPTI